MKTITHPVERWLYATRRDDDNCWEVGVQAATTRPADEPIRVVSVLNPSWTDQQIRGMLDKLADQHQRKAQP